MDEIPEHISIDSQLELRLLKRADATELFNLTDQNRHHLDQWFSWVKAVRTVDDTRRFIGEAESDLAIYRAFHYGIWLDRRLVGTVGAPLWQPVNRIVELGYWLGEKYQGQGIVTRSVDGLIRALIKQTEISRFEIRCQEQNLPSQRIPKRLGFRLLGPMAHQQGRRRLKLLIYRTDRASYASLPEQSRKKIASEQELINAR